MTAPLAVAGADQDAVAGSFVHLDGSGSTGATGHAWSIRHGPQDGAKLVRSDQVRAGLDVQLPGDYLICLTVISESGTAEDTLSVSVAPFQARIRGDRPTTTTGTVLSLDGGASDAPTGSTYAWSIESTLGQTFLTQSDQVTARFLAGSPGTHRVKLTVATTVAGEDNPRLISSTAIVDINVTESIETGGEADDVYWRDQQTDIDRKVLDTTRASASKWEASITSLLGVFAAVAFLVGPNALKDLGNRETAQLGLVLVGGAFAYAFLARLAVADVGSDIPTFGQWQDPAIFRDRVFAAAKLGARRLRRARLYAVVAAILVAAGSLAVAHSTLSTSPAKPPLALVRMIGETRCGELANDNGNITVDGRPAVRVLEIVTVTDCGTDASVRRKPDRVLNTPAWLLGGLALAGFSLGMVSLHSKEKAVPPVSFVLGVGILCLVGRWALVFWTDVPFGDARAFETVIVPVAEVVAGFVLHRGVGEPKPDKVGWIKLTV